MECRCSWNVKIHMRDKRSSSSRQYYNTWPSMALCERQLDPPLQSDLQLCPCFIMALMHKSGTRRSVGNAQFKMVWSDSISRQVLSPWCSLLAQSRQHVQYVPFQHASECVFFPLKWVRTVNWVMGDEKGNPFMYYQMFPFRNSTLFSILVLKRMCSRLYPAC